MNEKGFATILGLCLILAITLVTLGIQESEGNHSYETTDFQTEYDLQNTAEVGIYKAAAMVRKDAALLPFNDLYPQIYPDARKDAQIHLISETIKTPRGSVTLDVWGERLVIKPYDVNYARKTGNKYNTYPFIDGNKQNLGWKVCAFFSVAELDNSQSGAEPDSSRTGEKLYRRAFGYFVESAIKERIGYIMEEIPATEEEKNIIRFMEVASDNLSYKEKNNNPDRK